MVIVEYSDGTLVTTAPTDNKSTTYMLQCQPSGSKMNVWAAVVTSGVTTITVNPSGTSAYDQSSVSSWSGVASTSELDGCSSTGLNNGSNAWFSSYPVLSTQTDLAIGMGSVPGTVNPCTSVSEWASLDTGTFVGDTLCTQYIINGTKSQYTTAFSNNSTGSGYGGVVLFKSLVTGSFSGQTPSVLLNMTGTNGNSVTASTLPLNPQTNGATTLTGSGSFTFSNTGSVAALTVNSINGSAYTENDTKALAYALSSTDQTFSVYPNFTTGPASFGCAISFPNTGANEYSNVVGIIGSGSFIERIQGVFQTSNSGTTWEVAMEFNNGNPVATIDITALIGTPVWVTGIYTPFGAMSALGTGISGLAVYNMTTGAQVGSTITYTEPSNATGAPKHFEFGRAEGNAVTGTMYFGRCVVDVNGTFPLKP